MSNLILTRRLGESIVLYKEDQPDEVLCKLIVTSLGNKQVRLAFEADVDLKIDRKEIYDKRQ
jgi:carbon storage regulator CsrA